MRSFQPIRVCFFVQITRNQNKKLIRNPCIRFKDTLSLYRTPTAGRFFKFKKKSFRVRVCNVEAISLSIRNPINRVSIEQMKKFSLFKNISFVFHAFWLDQSTWELLFIACVIYQVGMKSILSRTTPQGNCNCLTLIIHNM